MATALVKSGRDPQTIRSLADLVQPEALKTELSFFWARNGRRKTAQLHDFALTAIKVAKWWVKAPVERIGELQTIRREVAPKEMGMTPRNRARLRQFDDPENVRRLIDLPQAMFVHSHVTESRVTFRQSGSSRRSQFPFSRPRRCEPRTWPRSGSAGMSSRLDPEASATSSFRRTR
jgi:hypothetical protein